MEKVRITKVRSTIKRPKSQKRTMEALGLRKMNSSVEVQINPAIEGMINKVRHLINVDKI